MCRSVNPEERVSALTEVEVLLHAPVEKPQAPRPNLPPEEWAVLRAADKHAGTTIVCIMGTIFILGLIGYTAICLVAWS